MYVPAWKNQVVEKLQEQGGVATIPCSPTEVNILQCPGTIKEGYLPCSTTQVNILRHHISKTLWIRHHPYIWKHLWLSRDRLGVQLLSGLTCSQYLGPGIIKSMTMQWFSPCVVTFQVSREYFIHDNVQQ